MTSNRFTRLHGRDFKIPTFFHAVSDEPGDRLAIALVATPRPILRDGFRVSFSLDDGAIDLALARSGRVPVLMQHRESVLDMLGAVTKVWRDGGGLWTMFKLARGGEADRVWDLLTQGFPLSVSVNGHIIEMREIDRQEVARPGEDAEYLITKWRLGEVSICLFGGNEDCHVRPISAETVPDILDRVRSSEDSARQKVRRDLHLDPWLEQWAPVAAGKIAEELGVDSGRLFDALYRQVGARIRTIEEQFALPDLGSADDAAAKRAA